MSLSNTRYTCAEGHEFEAAGSGDYGEFVARGDASPVPGILEVLDNPVYDEVDAIIRSLGGYRGMPEPQQADLLQSVFGLACDPGPDGTLLRIGRRAPCPVCGTREMRFWEQAGPYSGPLFQVTHERWLRLSQQEKEKRVANALGG